MRITDSVESVTLYTLQMSVMMTLQLQLLAVSYGYSYW